jgi:hypothetical protein
MNDTLDVIIAERNHFLLVEGPKIWVMDIPNLPAYRAPYPENRCEVAKP